MYFLELVRYIHSNPIRAGGVKSVEELDVYGWSGHSAVVGNKIRPWQDTESVLSQFGEKRKLQLKDIGNTYERGYQWASDRS